MFRLIAILILLFVSCATPQETRVETIPEAPKMEPIIEEVKTSSVLQAKPVLRERISKALEDCKKYGDDVMVKFNSCIDMQNKQASLIAKYKSDVLQLEEEIRTWRQIKYTAYAIVGIMILVVLVRLFYPIIIGLIRKSAGLP